MGRDDDGEVSRRGRRHPSVGQGTRASDASRNPYGVRARRPSGLCGSEITSDRLHDRPHVRECLGYFLHVNVQRVVLALVPEVAQGIELIEVSAAAEVVEGSERVLARLRVSAGPGVVERCEGEGRVQP